MPGYDGLYGGKPPFEKDSDTSESAADSVTNSALNLREQVYHEIKDAGRVGKTCWEIEQELELQHQTASARIRELVLKGRVMDSHHRRKTGSDRMATVWVVANMPEFVPGPHKTLTEKLRDAEQRIRDLEDEVERLKNPQQSLF